MLTFSQIVDKIDRACGTNSTSYTLAQKAVDVNLAQNEVYAIALKNTGWNIDDFNQSHDPFITTDLVSGQRDYHFTYDEDSNLILGISRVMVKNSASGTYQELEKVNMYGDAVPSTLIDGNDSTGVPTKFGLVGNGIFLDLIPSYDSTAGLKLFVDREPTYFLSTDTTKVSGIDGLCHEYLYLKPAYEWARDKGLQSVERLYRDLQDAKKKIEERYGRRDKYTIKRILPAYQNNR